MKIRIWEKVVWRESDSIYWNPKKYIERPHNESIQLPNEKLFQFLSLIPKTAHSPKADLTSEGTSQHGWHLPLVTQASPVPGEGTSGRWSWGPPPPAPGTPTAHAGETRPLQHLLEARGLVMWIGEAADTAPWVQLLKHSFVGTVSFDLKGARPKTQVSHVYPATERQACNDARRPPAQHGPQTSWVPESWHPARRGLASPCSGFDAGRPGMPLRGSWPLSGLCFWSLSHPSLFPGVCTFGSEESTKPTPASRNSQGSVLECLLPLSGQAVSLYVCNLL